VRAEFLEQNGTEHHVAVFATLAALDVNHHPLAINVADLQTSQLRVPNTGGIESHEYGAVKRSGSGVDELCYLFLAEDGGQAVCLLGIRGVGNAPWFLKRLNVEKPQSTQVIRHRTGRQLPIGEEIGLVLANVLLA
jgi:hypothetical protein